MRGLTPEIRAQIERGAERSATFRKLIAALNASDVVVYVDVKPLPPGLEGRLMFLTSAGGVRYLHAQVTSGLGFEDLIAIAGHELQHAVEVAMHPDVRDAPGLAMLYERIGIRSHVRNRYDTAEAQLTGKRVRAEMS